MKITDVRFALSEAVAPIAQEHGFSDHKHDCDFIRRSNELIFQFKLQVYAKTGWFFAKPLVGVGCSTLNKLFNQIVQPKDRVDVGGPTIGLYFGISNEYPSRGDYNMENISDTASAATKIKGDFVEIALPYFEKNKDLESLEKTLNPRSSNGAYVPTTVSAACMGLIAARLCGRADFEAMADFHYSFIAKVQRKELAIPILKVKDYYLNSKDK